MHQCVYIRTEDEQQDHLIVINMAVIGALVLLSNIKC